MSTPSTQTIALQLKAAWTKYVLGTPIMDDPTFDALEASLYKLDPLHPLLAEIGSPSDSGWPKVEHPIPMGSLDKAQEAVELQKWAVRIGGVSDTQPVFMSEKMDGISILLTYSAGHLTRAETRGNGSEGEEITRNVRIMQGVQNYLPHAADCYIRGEIVCRKSDFEDHFPNESNPRNTAAGTARRHTHWGKARHLTFYAYNVTAADFSSVSASREEEFDLLNAWGFRTPGSYLLTTIEEIHEARKSYISKQRSTCDYDIDGLVIEINDTKARNALGEHNLRPKGATAFKFPHEMSSTILRGVRWQVGNSGRVTPVALFDTVHLAGADIKQASLHNIGNIQRLCVDEEDLSLREGSEILVSRRNDVIPFVESLTEGGGGRLLLPPTECPSCNSELQMLGEYLMCPTADQCPAQALGALRRWVTKLGVLHFGDALLQSVLDAGLVSRIGDLYRIDEEEMAALETGGRKIGGSAKRALRSLHSKKEITLDLLVGSLGIPSVGRKMSKILVDAGFDSIEALSKVTVEQMAAVPGFGEGRAASFREGFDKHADTISDIMAAGVQLVAPVQATGTGMAGQVIVMSGGKPKDIVAAVTEQGGKIGGSVSSKTTILMLKDPTSTSSKAVKARGLGVEVLGWDDMRARLGLS